MKKINITWNVINTIKNRKIKPIPKLYYTIKKIIIYSLTILLLLISGISMSIVFSYLFEIDYSLFSKFWFTNIIFIFLPIFWILLILFVSIMFYFLFKKTEWGYKYWIISIINLNILLSLFFWYLFFTLDINEKAENYIKNYINDKMGFVYKEKHEVITKMWQNPERWLLIWEITSLHNWYIKIIDTNKNEWFIRLAEDTLIRSDVILDKWIIIKIEWELLSIKDFKANRIIPYIHIKLKTDK